MKAEKSGDNSNEYAMDLIVEIARDIVKTLSHCDHSGLVDELKKALEKMDEIDQNKGHDTSKNHGQ